MTKSTETQSTVGATEIKEFIDGLSMISKENQLVLFGMLKGMVAVNDITASQKGG